MSVEEITYNFVTPRLPVELMSWSCSQGTFKDSRCPVSEAGLERFACTPFVILPLNMGINRLSPNVNHFF